jgi:hypothetical protein
MENSLLPEVCDHVNLGRRPGLTTFTGSKGTFVWEYRTKAALTTPGHTPTWGATTVAVWRSHPDLPDELLAFGTQNGHLVFWRQTAHVRVAK